MAVRSSNTFTTIRTEGALLPPDLLQRIADGDNQLEGLTPADYHRPGEKLNEAINHAWNALQGAWANFKAAQERLPVGDLGTTITRERWLLPLFRELEYGRLQTAPTYQIDSKSYPISHHWEEQVPIHLVSYQLDLDHRTPGIAGAAAASPHSLVQVYLNRSDANLWGFVSNGYKLRILRDNVSLTRQSYVEFDLYSMMDGEVYADFVLLWLLCHQSRVENGRECWLEKWMNAAKQQGARALDQLRDGVQQAIEALGVGFLEHPHNTLLRDRLQNGTLNAQDYYRQLLRLVYRLLFLFVAEDRGLLYDPAAPQETRDLYTECYSTQRLRRIAERLKGTRHTDLFESLRLVMKLLSGEGNGAVAKLGVPVLGSFLFSDDAVTDVINCQIGNLYLLDAVRVLAFMQDRAIHVLRSVDYKNLGSDELGSVYESLLELHPQINVPARTFALATAGGNERKTTGSYYTPTSLINALLESALNPVIAEALQKPDPKVALLNLKICDPACGSGHFLIAAAHRVAKALASVRTGEEEPAPEAVRHALRDVIGNCIYGVDINPMAVELCKVALWLDALEPGKPLSFLDHRIQCGNSLFGTTPRLMAEGIPEGAFQPIEGDDKKFTTNLRKQNEIERRQNRLFDVNFDTSAETKQLATGVESLDAIRDDSITGVREKEARFLALAQSVEYRSTRLLADAWCAAFVWVKIPGAFPISNFTLRQLRSDPDSVSASAISEIARLAEQYQFFHWHIAFPDVFHVPADVNDAQNEQTGWEEGFDCVLGNPPWERIKIQEKEWFAQRNPDIANAPNAAARKRRIDDLVDRDPYLLEAFHADLRLAEGESHFVRTSGHYPLCGRGDVNTYTIFAEAARCILGNVGHAGMIVPSGIATDDTTKFFFQDLMDSQSLTSLYDFENREGLFPAVDSRMKFCLLTMTGPDARAAGGAQFVFFAQNVNDLRDSERLFTLSAADIALLNPNTRTCATFRSQRDAELTKAIYRRVPVLIREAQPEDENPWGISFLRMFDMSNDSHLFRTREQLEQEGYVLDGNRFTGDKRVYLPLYEGRMIHHFDHRAASVVEGRGTIRTAASEDTTTEQHYNPNFAAQPRYWVQAVDIDSVLDYSNSWFIGFKDVTSATNERTLIDSIIPYSAVGNKIPLLLSDENADVLCGLGANLSSFCMDFVVRQKIGGVTLNFYLVRQFPILPSHTYTHALLDFIVRRVLELSYSAWDLKPFAQDVGYDGPPFIWDEDRRFLMRCELDALYFHLYSIARDDVDYIMETFPIVKRKDEAAHGEYPTKHVILEMYDQMAALQKVRAPHPKGEDHGEYLVPDVSQFQTWLNPPPADPSVAHT